MKVAARIYQNHISTVIDLVVTIVAGNFSERRIEPSSDTEHLGEVTRYTCEVWIVVRNITRQLLNSITGGIHRQHDHPGGFCFSALQRLAQLGEKCHRGGADIWTVGKTKK